MTKSQHRTDRTDSPPLAARLRRWVIGHDDSWLFFVPYIVLAVVPSAVSSLFWFVLIVGVLGKYGVNSSGSPAKCE